MEVIHKVDARHFISPEICLAQLYNDWLHFGAHTDVNPDTSLAEKMNVSPLIISELETVCGIDTLTCADEPIECASLLNKKLEPHDYKIPSEHNLQCLKVKQLLNKKRESNFAFRQYLNTVNKFRYTDSSYKPSTNESISQKITRPELLLTVTIYQPYKKNPGEKNLRELKVEQQILVLGSQKLIELRDRFTCLSDVAVLSDISENPDAPQDFRAKDVYTSGFFYINGIFYNDMRNPQSRDNSRVIIDWAKNYPDMEIGPFETKLMEETRFVDLKLRLGYPYLYQHQGDCEHLIIFQDIRLLSPEDCQDAAKYPLIITTANRRRVVCMVCHTQTARWVTSKNKRVPADPFFFCNLCFRQFNYDESGRKIGDFLAYPYVDRSAFMEV